jgi:ABC-type transport system involved in cytochrome c biogenesis permease subunit
MLTISIVAGAVMLHLSGNAQAWLTDPKIAATAAMWIAYAVLMHMRTSADRHGRRLALATIVGLFFLLFTFVGVHLIAESIHDFVLTTAMGN